MVRVMGRRGHQKVRPNVRWNDETERILQDAADVCGVSKAQFIREAILMRAILILGEQEATGAEEISRLRAVSEQVRQLAKPD